MICKQTLEWAIPEKIQTGWRPPCENSSGIFQLFTLPLEIPDKAAQTLDIPKNCV